MKDHGEPDAAVDPFDLRRALGASRVNLLGFSYGTELALAVLRLDVGGVARVVLAGVRGPDQLLKMPGTFDATLRQVSRLAAESSAFKGTLRGSHETLPLSSEQRVVVDFFRGADVAGRRLSASPPEYLGIEAAATQPCGPRGC